MSTGSFTAPFMSIRTSAVWNMTISTRRGVPPPWRAAETFDDRQGVQFHSYAFPVIRNHLLDYCRKIQSQTAPMVFLEA